MDNVITALPADIKDHVLFKPIPIYVKHYKSEQHGVWIAQSKIANIGMSGDSKENAIENLTYNIIYFFRDMHTEYQKSIPMLKKDYNALRKFIRRI